MNIDPLKIMNMDASKLGISVPGADQDPSFASYAEEHYQIYLQQKKNERWVEGAAEHLFELAGFEYSDDEFCGIRIEVIDLARIIVREFSSLDDSERALLLRLTMYEPRWQYRFRALIEDDIKKWLGDVLEAALNKHDLDAIAAKDQENRQKYGKDAIWPISTERLPDRLYDLWHAQHRPEL